MGEYYLLVLSNQSSLKRYFPSIETMGLFIKITRDKIYQRDMKIVEI